MNQPAQPPAAPPPPTPAPASPAVVVPVIARIEKITLSDYRAFPANQTFEFNLGPEGKNLLLFGENGSGKTSLFRAFRDLTALKPGPVTYVDLRHIYAPGEEGFISIQLTAGTPFDFRWDFGDPHPRETGGQPYALLAERCRFLDYKALLKTNFLHRDPKPNLFDLLIEDILTDLPVSLAGQRDSLGNVYAMMRAAKPADHRSTRNLDVVDTACADFTTVLKGHLPDVVTAGKALLTKMGVEGLDFDLVPETVTYDRNRRDFVGLQIALSVRLFGELIDHPQLFLNEARLTAIAISIYLGAASLVLESPTAGADGTIKVRLLVLDDVLIGLDLSNRLPVLKVLNEDFADWQIILMTYDRVWFELAKIETAASERWVFAELHAKPMQVGTTVIEAPVLEPMQGTDSAAHFLTMAKRQLASNERIAAFHARTAFEIKLKHYCHEKAVQVPYDLDGRKLTTDHFILAIERRLNWSGKLSKAIFALNRVKLFRHGVLNPLAHYHPVTLSPNEVELAITAVRALEFVSDKTDFAKECNRVMAKANLSDEERVDAAAWLRTAFEVDLRQFLVKHQGCVRYRHDWTDMTLAELWVAAKERMTAINSGVASGVIASVEAHRRVFLDEWTFAAVSQLTKPDLDAAWVALRDSSSSSSAPKTRLAVFS